MCGSAAQLPQCVSGRFLQWNGPPALQTSSQLPDPAKNNRSMPAPLLRPGVPMGGCRCSCCCLHAAEVAVCWQSRAAPEAQRRLPHERPKVCRLRAQHAGRKLLLARVLRRRAPSLLHWSCKQLRQQHSTEASSIAFWGPPKVRQKTLARPPPESTSGVTMGLPAWSVPLGMQKNAPWEARTPDLEVNSLTL